MMPSHLPVGTAEDSGTVLSVRQLGIGLSNGSASLVRDISFSLKRGECFALVGESGCGKSLTAMSLAGLLPSGVIQTAGEIIFQQQHLQTIDEPRWQALRGNSIGVIFQNPLTAFNPTTRIGDQIAEVLVRHKNLAWSQARRQAIDLLARMEISAPQQRARQYPFEFSGGMLQRAMIAMAVACKPQLLIADEPTTALDVTVQAQVLALLRDLQREQSMALLLITHDLGVVAEMADAVGVMYAGSFVETGSAAKILHEPAHPYTRALKAALPVLNDTLDAQDYIPLTALAGTPPDPAKPQPGCALLPRCRHAMRICAQQTPPWFGAAQQTNRCWLHYPRENNSGDAHE